MLHATPIVFVVDDDISVRKSLESLIDSVPMNSAERAAMLAAVGAVPEPAGVGVVMAGCLALRRRARRTPPKH